MFGSNCAATTEVRISDRYVLPVNFLSSLNKNGEKEMTKPLYVALAAAAMFVCASSAIAQDARVRADRLESDVANGVQPNGSNPAQPRIIWRTPEIVPRTWEEQRVFDRSSQGFWMFPSTGNE